MSLCRRRARSRCCSCTWRRTDLTLLYVSLSQAGTFEVLLVHLAPLFNSTNHTMMFANGKLYKKDAQAVRAAPATLSASFSAST